MERYDSNLPAEALPPADDPLDERVVVAMLRLREVDRDAANTCCIGMLASTDRRLAITSAYLIAGTVRATELEMQELLRDSMLEMSPAERAEVLVETELSALLGILDQRFFDISGQPLSK